VREQRRHAVLLDGAPRALRRFAVAPRREVPAEVVEPVALWMRILFALAAAPERSGLGPFMRVVVFKVY
jgi:hypothetical protein